MKIIAAAVVAMIAVVAAAGFGWQKNQALQEAKAELAIASSQLQKAKDDSLAMRAETAALRKEIAEQKLAAESSLAEAVTMRQFLDAEKAAGARLREELMRAKEQLASVGRPRSAQAVLPLMQVVPVRPRAIQIQPSVIRAAPSGLAIGAGVPAR